MIRRNSTLLTGLAVAILFFGGARAESAAAGLTDAELIARAKDGKPHGRNLQLAGGADGIHFKKEGQLTLGRMIADQVETVYKKL